MTDKLSGLATLAINEISGTLIDRFTSKEDTSYKRAMFKQNGEYGCSLVIDVLLIDGDKKAHIITKFGKQS